MTGETTRTINAACADAGIEVADTRDVLQFALDAVDGSGSMFDFQPRQSDHIGDDDEITATVNRAILCCECARLYNVEWMNGGSLQNAELYGIGALAIYSDLR